MRMWDITFLIICFELSLGFTAGIGLFGHNYFAPIQEEQGSHSAFLVGDISSTGELLNSQKQNTADYFTISAALLWGSIGLLLNIGASVAFFMPHLILTFQFPLVLAVPIQALIYACYTWSIAQFLSGRSGGLIQ